MSLKINGQLVTNVSLQGKSVVRILREDEVLWEKENLDYFYLENETDTEGTFTCTKTGSPAAPNLEYSTDGVNWTTADMSDTWTTQVPARGMIYLRGDNGTSGFNRDISSYYYFSMDVDHSAHGNIMSIENYNTMDEVTAVPYYCFGYLFKSDMNLIDANGMNFGNVTSIGDYGCREMFNGCSALTTAPDLSNLTSIGDYGCNSMFNDCSALTTAPDLSNLTSINTNGCSNMFYYCTALTTAPDLSNLTSIGYYSCRVMFNGCSALTTAPDLSNVTSIGDYGCDGMFNGCSNLQTVYAPNLATWSTSFSNNWVYKAGSSAAEPKIMYFPSQALMDSYPSGASGYGTYEKHLLNSIALHITTEFDGITYSVDDGEPIALPNKGYGNYFDIEIPDSANHITFHDTEPSKLRKISYYVDGKERDTNFLNGDITIEISNMDLDRPIDFHLYG